MFAGKVANFTPQHITREACGLVSSLENGKGKGKGKKTQLYYLSVILKDLETWHELVF